MASFHKVIKLLKFKSEANLHCFQWKAQSREHILKQNLIRSRSPYGDHICIKINRLCNLQLDTVPRQLKKITGNNYAYGVFC